MPIELLQYFKDAHIKFLKLASAWKWYSNGKAAFSNCSYYSRLFVLLKGCLAFPWAFDNGAALLLTCWHTLVSLPFAPSLSWIGAVVSIQHIMYPLLKPFSSKTNTRLLDAQVTHLAKASIPPHPPSPHPPNAPLQFHDQIKVTKAIVLL